MNTKTYAGRSIARLFLCSKNAYTNNRISGGLFSGNVTIKTLWFFAFRRHVVAQFKAEVNGKNCTSLRAVAFALCARLR